MRANGLTMSLNSESITRTSWKRMRKICILNKERQGKGGIKAKERTIVIIYLTSTLEKKSINARKPVTKRLQYTTVHAAPPPNDSRRHSTPPAPAPEVPLFSDKPYDAEITLFRPARYPRITVRSKRSGPQDGPSACLARQKENKGP